MKKVILIILFLYILPFNNVKAISASSAIVMDMDSNRILYSQNIHKVRSVASISKIMTAILAIENSDLDKKITISNVVKEAYGSAIYIKENETMTMKDLIYGLMLRSGNDAAIVIANEVSGSEKKFVEMMNEKARKLNMKNTIFNNPSGLEYNGGNTSTSYDMALLISYAMKNKIYREITATKKYTLKTNLNTYIWQNKNKLLNSYKFTTGGKTGYTEIAKRTLVTSATKDHLNLCIVTLNDGNDFNDHKDLYEEYFDIYDSYLILKEGKINILDETYYDYLYIKKDFKYPLSNLEKNSVILKFELNKKNNYENNSKIGTVSVKLGDEIIHSQDIYVKKIFKKDNIFKKIYYWLFK